ncbi:MAG: ATP-grasp domain-containing protein, partial [Haliea sp.]
MQYLTEDLAKAALCAFGLPAPSGKKATSADQAANIAEESNGPVVVKALVPTGRRGLADAVRFADTPAQAASIADELIGKDINGFTCRAVYVEPKVEISNELYLSFILEDFPARILISTEGGVDIEAVSRDNPEAIISAEINPLRGLPVWDATDLWESAGINTELLPEVAALTSRLYEFFVANDGVMLELNPVALDPAGKPHLVGAMLSTEDTMFEGAESDAPLDERAKRERRVIEANRKFPGGMIRYNELDGDIGMFVGGGGAGLHQHDLILEAGGNPANHTDASTINMDKVRALIDVILDNPNVNSLFISWHYQQMAQIDKRVIPAIEAIKDRGIDPCQFP